MRPFGELEEAVRRIARGDLSARIPVRGLDEIGTLARAFNQMAEALQTSHQLLAGQLGLERARLEALREIGEAVTQSAERAPLLTLLLGRTATCLGADAAILRLADPTGQWLDLTAHHNLDPALAKEIERAPVDGSASGAAYRSRAPIVVEDLASNPWPYFASGWRQAGFVSLLSLPLLIRGEPVGVFNFFYRQRRAHEPAELRVALAFGGSAAVAIEHARLYEESRSLLAEREAQASALLAVGRRLEAILRGIGEAVIVTNPEDRVLLLNPVAQELLGIREDDVAGEDLLSFLEDQEFAAEWRRSLEADQDFVGRSMHISYPVSRILSATRTRFREESGAALGHVTILRDITREREIDRMKTEFISNVTHELRTPMATIKGFIATILRHKGMAAETRERFLGIIDEESDRLTALINDLLDISRMESGRFQLERKLISLTAAVDRSLAVMAPQFEKKGLELVRVTECGACEIVGDIDRICQVTQNLLSNALKFTAAGGRVSIRLQEDAEAAILDVEDTGVGIAPEHLPRIFERFFRAPGSETGGTGLGLAIVKEIVERHRGRIDVISEPGKGSRFQVTLPHAESDEKEAAT